MDENIYIYHPYEDKVHFLDFGDVEVYSTEDKEFRLKNSSDVYRAVNLIIEVAPTDGYDADPSIDSQFLISKDGENFTTQLEFGDLLPKITTPIITARRITSKDAEEMYSVVSLNIYIDGWYI